MNNLNKMNEKIKINNPENSKWWGKSLWWVRNIQAFKSILSISLCVCVCIKIHNPVHNNLYYLRTLRVYRLSNIPHIGNNMSSVYGRTLELHSWEHRKIIYVNRMNPTIFYAFCRNVFFFFFFFSPFLVVYWLMFEPEQIEDRVIKSLHIAMKALKEPL